MTIWGAAPARVQVALARLQRSSGVHFRIENVPIHTQKKNGFYRGLVLRYYFATEVCQSVFRVWPIRPQCNPKTRPRSQSKPFFFRSESCHRQLRIWVARDIQLGLQQWWGRAGEGRGADADEWGPAGTYMAKLHAVVLALPNMCFVSSIFMEYCRVQWPDVYL